MTENFMKSALTSLPLILALIVVSFCSVTDLLWRRIPNVVTLPTVGIGLLLGSILGGWKGLGLAAAGMGAGFVLMIVPYYLGGMGAGDVKLMAAIGALLGLSPIIQVFLYTTLIGGVIAVISALSRGTLKRALRNIATWTTSLALQRLGGLRGGLTKTELEQTAGTIPYGVAIALGLIAYLSFGRVI
ncbi:MAG: prepilin peptidase [Candidatus Zixiibacteriota bacterium]